MALFDLSSSWLEGSQCPLAARGYSRDGKKGKLQVEYGLLTDPAAFTQIVQVVRNKLGLGKMVMVGGRGMITSVRIAALNKAGDGTARPDPTGGSPRCAPRRSRSSWPTTGPCSCPCSMSRTWPRSPPATSPGSG